MLNSNGLSLSDIAAVTGRNNEDGFGGNNGWWILIILFALFGGWGNNGYGAFGGGSNGSVTDGYVLASDFSNIERKIDGVNNGLCDGFYAMNTGMLNGFSGVNTAIMQGTNSITAGITGIGTQLQQCCCDNRAAIADLKYQLATDSCAVTNAINQAAQNIINNDNANYRTLHDENVAIQMAAKDETIAQLRAQANFRDINDSNTAQSAYLLAQLRPAAVPAYVVQNPYGCNCNTGCCCG